MAARILAQEGQTVSVYFTDEAATYNPNTGTSTGAAPVVVLTKAAFLDLIQLEKGDTSYPRALLEQSNKECYLTPAPTFPRIPNAIGDYIIDSAGIKWRINYVKSNNPSGAKEIMFKLLLKR
jgi:hypothetical protein